MAQKIIHEVHDITRNMFMKHLGLNFYEDTNDIERKLHVRLDRGGIQLFVFMQDKAKSHETDYADDLLESEHITVIE